MYKIGQWIKYLKHQGSKRYKKNNETAKKSMDAVRVEKIDTYKGVSVKALLDSKATGLFVDKKFMKKWRFKKEKLARPIQIRNMDGTDNSGRMVMYEIECNLYYKKYVEWVKMDICDLERMEVILGMPWLVVHNSKID